MLYKKNFSLIVVGQEEVRGEEVERRGALGLGHRGGQLRHLQVHKHSDSDSRSNPVEKAEFS